METNLNLSPYLFFGGRCEEAMAHYANALGAEVEMMMRFSESPSPVPEGFLAEGFESKVMHASLKLKSGSQIMMSDGCAPGSESKNVSLYAPVATREEADRLFAMLSEGGSVIMPLAETFWSPYYGMVDDKFGIGWMISIPGN